MQNREKIEPTIAYLNSISDSPLVVNKQDLDKILEKSNTKQQPIIIKILIIIGAILTCVFSLGFLLLIGLYDSSIGMIFTGLIMLFAAVFLTLKSQVIFLDTILLSCYCAGFGLLGVGLFIETESPSIISMVLLILSLITLYISKNYIILFTSIFIALGSTKVLISQVSPILDMLYYVELLS